MSTEQIKKKVESILGWPGVMISGSKSGYRKFYPNNLAVFNSNVCLKSGKVWHGDLDLSESKITLQNLANQLKEDVYVLYEMDARFENEKTPRLERAVAIFHPGGKVTLRQDLGRNFKNFSDI